MKKLALYAVALGLIVFLGLKVSHKFLKPKNIKSNTELLAHMRSKFPKQANFMVLIKDQRNKDHEYFQLVYKTPVTTPKIDSKLVFQDVLMELLKTVYDNQESLSKLSSMTMVTLDEDMKNPSSAIVGTKVIQELDENLLASSNFKEIVAVLAKKCPKTQATLLEQYCMIRP